MSDRVVDRKYRGLVLWAALALTIPALPLIAASGPDSAPDAAAIVQTQTAGQAPDQKSAGRSSPWLLVPVVSSNPKLGTSFGALGAYLRKFDPDSQVSMFGLTYQYTSTHSTIAGAFARTSFGADHHRIVGIAIFGYIKNDYDDYLGTGQPLKTNDDLKALRGAISLPCGGRLVHRRAGQRGELSGAWRIRAGRSRSRDAGHPGI